MPTWDSINAMSEYMPDNNLPAPDFDWRLANFDGARREQLRRWAQLPLEDILLAIEQMEDISRLLASTQCQDGQSPIHNHGTGKSEKGHKRENDGIKE